MRKAACAVELYGRCSSVPVIGIGAVIERLKFDEVADALVAHIRPRRPSWRRCGRRQSPAPGYGAGEGRCRWRSVDLGMTKAFLEADAPVWRVRCTGWWSRRCPGPGTVPGSSAMRRAGRLAGLSCVGVGGHRAGAHRGAQDRGHHHAGGC